MEIEESKMFLESRVPETPAKTSVPNEEINLTVRRRNEKTNVVCIEDNDLDSTGRACPDKISVSAEANSDDTSSRIPSITYVDSPSKQNGSLSRKNDDDLYDCNLGDTRVLTKKERIKLSNIQSSIGKPDITVEDLELLGCTAEGLVNGILERWQHDIRRVLWPRLLRLSDENNVSTSELETIHERVQNDVYQQILKDVARSNSHMPENAAQEEIDRFHKELTQLICWVLHRHSALKSVWFLNSVNWKAITNVMLSRIGYNDIAATVLLVMGLESGLSVLESISLRFLERFMEKTMEKVNQELYFIFALLERVHPTLLEHLENVELFPHFALAEYTTWYAHKYAENRKLLHRLFDYFLGSPPLMPLYLSTVIVACRAAEIFNTTPDMGHTHKVLCTLPDDLPFESLLIEATKLYRQYPPESISNDVKEYDYKRKCKEQEWKAKAEASRQERKRQRKLRIVPWTPRIPYRIRSYKTITAVTILALGIYAFLKSSSGLN